MSLFSDAVVKRMEEEDGKLEAASAPVEAAPAVEAPEPEAPVAPEPVVQAQPAVPEPAPAAAPAADRNTKGPIAALRAERIQRQSAEREVASLMSQLEAYKRAPPPAAAQPAQTVTVETVDDLIDRLSQSDDELQNMTAKEIKALRDQVATVAKSVSEQETWRNQIQSERNDASFDVWLEGFKQHVPGMPEAFLLRSLKGIQKGEDQMAALTSIVADWHEYLEANPNAAVANRPAPPIVPARPVAAPPPRVAAPSRPLSTQVSGFSKADVFKRLQQELDG